MTVLSPKPFITMRECECTPPTYKTPHPGNFKIQENQEERPGYMAKI